MPTIPKTRSVSPNISPTFQNTAGSTPDAFGAGVGRAVQGLGQSIQQASEAAVQIAKEDMAREAKQLDNEYAQALANISFGDGTADNPGFYSLEGQNALNAAPDMLKQVKDVRAKISARATNDRVRSIFNASADERDIQQTRADGRFINAARKSADDSAANARMSLAISDAARFYNDPAALDKKTAIMNGEVLARAQRSGQTAPEEIAAAQAEGRSAIATSAFDSAMAAEDFNSAKSIYDRYKGTITGEARSKMLASLQEGSVRVQAQALSARAQELFPNDRLAALKWIRENSSGKVEDVSLTNLRASLADIQLTKDQERQIKRDAEHDADYAYKMSERTKFLADRAAGEEADKIIESGKPFSAIPVEMRQRLSAEKQEALKKLAAHKASGEPFNTDWDKYSEYTGMSFNELVNVDLGIAKTQLSDEEFRVVRGLVDAARQGRGAATHLFTAQQIFNSNANAVGLGGAENAEKRGRLSTMYQEQLRVEQQKQGNRPLSDEQMRNVFNALVDEQVLIDYGWFWRDKTQSLFEVEVPEDQRLGIVQRFQKQYGRTPTQAEIAQTWVNEYNAQIKRNK